MRTIALCSALALAFAAPSLAQSQPEEIEPAAGTETAPEAGASANAEQAQMTDAVTFARTAAASNRFEIESSGMALQQDISSEVQEFAQRMIEDHTQAGQTLQDILGEEELGLDEEHAVKLTSLQEASPEEFEQLYVDMQVKAHEQAAALFEGFAENGDNPELQAFAEQTLPTLREHKDMIDEIAGNPG